MTFLDAYLLAVLAVMILCLVANVASGRQQRANLDEIDRLERALRNLSPTRPPIRPRGAGANENPPAHPRPVRERRPDLAIHLEGVTRGMVVLPVEVDAAAAERIKAQFGSRQTCGGPTVEAWSRPVPKADAAVELAATLDWYALPDRDERLHELARDYPEAFLAHPAPKHPPPPRGATEPLLK